jgi:hypothetical protein
MTTDQIPMSVPVFLQTVSGALARLKQQLQHDYEQAYPGLGEIVHLVLDEEEGNAWKLSLFPHLVFPDLVETHIAKLNLRPADTKHVDISAPHRVNPFPFYQPAAALCG